MTAVATCIMVLPRVLGNIASRSTYAHACDSDWLQIVLTGQTYGHEKKLNTAQFSLVETGELLWTWTSNDPVENDFNLASLDSTSTSLLPSLGNVTINGTTNELTRAWCYNTTNQCATGYVWPFDGLFFEVQFNGMVTRMRNKYHGWSFENIPGVIMHRVDEKGALAERLLHTLSGSCKDLKLCISDAMRRRDRIFDPDVLVVAYWLLQKQAAYAIRYCD